MHVGLDAGLKSGRGLGRSPPVHTVRKIAGASVEQNLTASVAKVNPLLPLYRSAEVGLPRAMHVDHFYQRHQALEGLGTVTFALYAMSAHRMGFTRISLIAGGGRGHDRRMIGCVRNVVVCHSSLTFLTSPRQAREK
ncbi:hypothetical protein G3N58_21855 [Paraburkholderia sp. Ac-20342]|uniref:hypothetical protein n=1 Tax=Paraburkholderia sp. Ac-20342 TaxID=2703889 RepID=UPI00197D9967|nr:hypothetical protein [Paraburkholderia sp. Ac-20342]MBN3849447.1 hypothetical protein [Paraburkholderia sp. Ac-20342]